MPIALPAKGSYQLIDLQSNAYQIQNTDRLKGWAQHEVIYFKRKPEKQCMYGESIQACLEGAE